MFDIKSKTNKMNENNNRFRKRGFEDNSRHWYSPDYRPNRSQRSDRYRIRDQSGFGSKLRSEKDRRFDSRPSVRITDISVELTDNGRTVRSTDPFDSPNPLVKDFRLYTRSPLISSNDIFCPKCDQMFSSSLDYTKHLETKHHKSHSFERQSLLETSNLKPSGDSDEFRRLLRRVKEPVTELGLNYIKESESDGFSCDLCKCYRLKPYNTVEHIRGHRHRSALQLIESKNKRRKLSENRETSKKSICSSTQTTDEYSGRKETTDRSVWQTNNSVTVESRTTERFQNRNPTESEFDRLFSCKKTIENFKTIRNICDQMIGFFSEQQNSVTNVLSENRSNTATDCQSNSVMTSFEYLSTKIKEELN